MSKPRVISACWSAGKNLFFFLFSLQRHVGIILRERIEGFRRKSQEGNGGQFWEEDDLSLMKLPGIDWIEMGGHLN